MPRVLLKETSGAGEGPWEAWVDGKFVCEVKDTNLAARDLEPIWDYLDIQVDFEVGWYDEERGKEL